jgi:hypothetical protein
MTHLLSTNATILSDDNRHLKELASQTYQNFILVMIASRKNRS